MGEAAAAQKVEAPIHQGIILACAFMGVPERLATASMEGAIVIWDTDAGRPIRRIAAHRGAVTALAWDAPRRRFISTGHDRRALAVDPASGRVTPFAELAAGPYALAISPSGEVLASGGFDGRIQLWRLTDGAPLGEWAGHDGAALDLDFLDDARLASVGRDYQVIVWDIARRTERLRTAGHERWAMRVRASADGRTIYSVGEDAQACAWSADSGALIWRRRFAAPIWGLERTADGSALIVGAGGMAARLDLEPGGPAEPQPISGATARAIARSPAGLMALGADSLTLYRGDAPEAPPRRLELGLAGYASMAALRRPGERPGEIAAVLARGGGEVELDLGGRRRALEPRHEGLAFAACSVGEAAFATTGFDGLICLRAADDGACLRRMDHGGLIFSVTASADGSRLLAVGHDAMSLWDPATGDLIWRGGALGAGFHLWGTLAADGGSAIAVGEGPVLHRWRFADGGAERKTLALDFGRLIGTCGLMGVVQIDAASAAVGTAAGEVRRVDLATGRSTLLHAEHLSGVRAMALSPDRRRLLSFSEHCVTRLYDLEAGRLCTPPAIEDAVVGAACFTPQGDLVWTDGSGVLHQLAA